MIKGETNDFCVPVAACEPTAPVILFGREQKVMNQNVNSLNYLFLRNYKFFCVKGNVKYLFYDILN